MGNSIANGDVCRDYLWIHAKRPKPGGNQPDATAASTAVGLPDKSFLRVCLRACLYPLNGKPIQPQVYRGPSASLKSPSSSLKKPVLQLDVETKEIVGRYDSLTEAAGRLACRECGYIH